MSESNRSYGQAETHARALLMAGPGGSPTPANVALAQVWVLLMIADSLKRIADRPQEVTVTEVVSDNESGRHRVDGNHH